MFCGMLMFKRMLEVVSENLSVREFGIFNSQNID
nr:MAG TPA: hypothetical protein [Caudoviricetes sp.]